MNKIYYSIGIMHHNTGIYHTIVVYALISFFSQFLFPVTH